MDHAVVVERLHRGAEPREQIGRPVRGQGSAGREARGEGLVSPVAHDDIGDPVHDASVLHADQPGMIELGQVLQRSQLPEHRLAGGGIVHLEELEGARPPHGDLAGLVDHSEGAVAEQALDLVSRDIARLAQVQVEPLPVGGEGVFEVRIHGKTTHSTSTSPAHTPVQRRKQKVRIRQVK